MRAWAGAIALYLVAAGAAAQVVLPAVEQGVFREDGTWELGPDAPFAAGRGAQGEERSVFVFDLSGLPGTPTSATLRIAASGIASPDRWERIVVHGVSSDPEKLVWEPTFEGVEPALGTFWDLGTGQVLGSARLPSPSSMADVPLDPSILRVLERTEGRVALGVSVTSLRRSRPDRPLVEERALVPQFVLPGSNPVPASLLVTAEGGASAAAPTTLHVAARARRGGTGAADAPLGSVAAALDLATLGDTVEIGPGVYAETLIMKDGVDVMGAGQDRTILDLGVDLPGPRCADALLQHLSVIQAPRLPLIRPPPIDFVPTSGSLDCTNGASPHVDEVFFLGAGIDLEGSAAWISNAVVTRITGVDSSPTVETSKVRSLSFDFPEAGAAPLRIERSRLSGLQISGLAPADSAIVGNLFAKDVTNLLAWVVPGGGIRVSAVGALGLIANNTMVGTEGIQFCDPEPIDLTQLPPRRSCRLRPEGGSAVVANNIIAFGTPGMSVDGSSSLELLHNDVITVSSVLSPAFNYVGLPDPTGTNGNLSVDPAFADRPSTFIGHGAADLDPSSPLIDAGTNGLVVTGMDLTDGPRLVDGLGDEGVVVDIGAAEFEPEESVRSIGIGILDARTVNPYGLRLFTVPSRWILIALYADDDFDAASEVDPASLRLNGWAPSRSRDLRCRFRDPNRDGRADLVCRFPSSPVWESRRVEKLVSLTGETFEGEPFEGRTQLDGLFVKPKDLR